MSNSKKSNIKSLYNVITKNKNKFGDLIQHIDHIQHLQSELYKYTGSPLNSHFIIANYNNNVLLLHADSPAWAAKLRYLTSDILSFMHQQCHLTNLKTIRIKVMPATIKSSKLTTRRLRLSAKSVKFINDITESISDQTLRSSLIKLTRHNQSNN